jgi:3-oxoacyl-[acyl-carrier protein] reductase
MQTLPEAAVYAPEELRVGLRAEFERDLTEADVLDFAHQSGDCNPLHVDEDYAESCTFGRRIVHGAFQVSLASALLGMRLPGRSCLLGSIQARFPAALMFPGRVKVRGEITAWNRDKRSGQLKVVVLDQHAIPTAEVLLGFTLHETRTQDEPVVRVAPSRNGHGDRPIVLVTGAAGGLGSALVEELARDYHILALVNREPLPDRLHAVPHVSPITAELGAADWEDSIRPALAQQPLYGVVHAAWPGSPHGGLLDAQEEVIERQLAFGTLYPIRLAKLVRTLAGPAGGRMILLGSLFGTHRPLVNRGAYSLGKAALEHTVKLLAPELARRNITINIVGPAFVPVGMNQASNDRHLKLELAQVPLGRLCTPQDVAQSVRYLLSPAASFISGQFLGLSGGQV